MNMGYSGSFQLFLWVLVCVCSQKPKQCLNVNVIVGEGLRAIVEVFSTITPLYQEMVTTVRMTGSKYIITRGDSLQSEHRSIRNWEQKCRLIAVCRQFHFVRYIFCLTRSLLYKSHNHNGG